MDSLQEFVRKLRSCKSLSEEKAAMDQECALIRTAFKIEAFNVFRRDNVEKLIYLHVNGYATHFGQIDVLKLCASSSFAGSITIIPFSNIK